MSRDIAIAFMTGTSLAVLASAHCAVMCGPVAMLTHTRGGQAGTLRYVLGRLVAYALLGAIAGSVGKVLLGLPQAVWFEAALSWSFALVLATTAYRLVRRAPEPALLTPGTRPRKSLVGRALGLVSHDPLLLGAATALLPCGALYGAVTASAALGDGLSGALAMLTFSAITGLSVVGVAQLGRVLKLGTLGRRGLALALVAGAVLMVFRPIPRLRARDHAPSCPMHAEAL